MAKSTNAVTEPRALLQKERDEIKKAIVDAEARLPALKADYEARNQVLNAHVKEVYASGMSGKHPLQIERDKLQAERQEVYNALSACQYELDRARPRLAELDRLLDADAAVEQLTSAYGAAFTNAGAAERKVKSCEDMIAAIDSEKTGRAERRKQVADANAEATIAHAEAALTAREEGKAAPDAPTPKRPAKADENDDDLDAQREAVFRLKTKCAAELQELVEQLTTMRQQLIRFRFDAADLRARAALFAISPEITEFEAARQVGRYYGLELELKSDDIAVRSRANAIEQELPVWQPAAKRDDVAQEPAGAMATTDTASAAAA